MSRFPAVLPIVDKRASTKPYKIVVLNLRRRPDRLAHMQTIFDDANVCEWSVGVAVDGKELVPSPSL